MKNIKRGQVWEIDLTPTKGAEMEKVRPCVVVSSDTLGVLPLRLVVPITEWNEGIILVNSPIISTKTLTVHGVSLAPVSPAKLPDHDANPLHHRYKDAGRNMHGIA